MSSCRLLRTGIIIQALLPLVPASQSLFANRFSVDAKVQAVLEHNPAKQPACEKPVVRLFQHLIISIITLVIAYRSDRHDILRL